MCYYNDVKYSKRSMMKRVLVTGATRGIGQAIAQEFKQGGAWVMGMGTQPGATPEYLDQYLDCDFGKQDLIDSVQNILASADIDILVNNAGINVVRNFCEIPAEEFRLIQQVNVYAPFRLCQMVLPHMVEQGWGRIVNISSVWGKKSKTGRASYSTSKFAIDGLTVALAHEFAQHNILVNAVAPGFIDTEMTWRNLGEAGVARMLENVPAKRLAKATEIAEFVAFLASEKNTYISGQNLSIDGGFTRA